MKKILSEKLPRITRNRKRLENALNVKITNRGKEVTIDGEPVDEYTAEKVIDAINFGFSLSSALLIKEEESIFEIINIKEHTKRKDLASIRARLIGTHGKTLKTMHDLTNSSFELKKNEVGIISPPDEMENAQNGVIAIIQGAKQANVYTFLEKSKQGEIDDLGLK